MARTTKGSKTIAKPMVSGTSPMKIVFKSGAILNSSSPTPGESAFYHMQTDFISFLESGKPKSGTYVASGRSTVYVISWTEVAMFINGADN